MITLNKLDEIINTFYNYMATMCSLVVLITFYNAYSTGTMQTLVTINQYKEAHIEAILFCLFAVAIIYKFVRYLQMNKIFKLLSAKLGFSEIYCSSCGGNLKPEGYRYTVCVDCNEVVEYPDGNLGTEGRGHLYKAQ